MSYTGSCSISGEQFDVSEQEVLLRTRFGLSPLPDISPSCFFRHLGAFWHHWNLHRRPSSRSGRMIISVYSEHCPYPVWHRDEWLADAEPPGAEFAEAAPVFEQLWDFFQRSPIPHNTGTGNENCEYTDDWWYSRNSYLSHSGYQNEDVRYCYRTVNVKNSQYCVFSFDSELCADLVNCRRCFQVLYAVNCHNCRDSAFLYDCRNCSNCMFCANLRHAKYCFFNRQLDADEYRRTCEKWRLESRRIYEAAKEEFRRFVRKEAFHRARQVDHCQNCTGDYLESCKNCINCYFAQEAEDCVNYIRGYRLKDQLTAIGNLMSELSCYSVLAQDTAYDTRFCCNVIQCRFVEYCAFCFQCDYCFGCCGLVGKKFHIFNKPFPEAEYEKRIKQIREFMRRTGEYGRFFPGFFAANPYDESWSAAHFPLTAAEQQKFGYRLCPPVDRPGTDHLAASQVPDEAAEVRPETMQLTYWDTAAQRPFRLLAEDVEFCRKLRAPLPASYYAERIRENYGWLHFDGRMRRETCARTGQPVCTTLAPELSGRILCEEEYLNHVG